MRSLADPSGVDARRELLARLAADGAAGARLGPLTFAQERFWLLHQLAGDPSVFNLVVAWRLEGPLVRDALRRACAGLVARHESLRTVLTASRATPVQIVRDSTAAVPFVEHDATGAPDPEQRARELLVAEGGRPVDLAAGPLFRAIVVRLGPRDHVFAVCVHHIVFDGASAHVALDDLAELYRAEVERREPELPALPLQPLDVAMWQRSAAHEAALREDLGYWRERLAGLAAGTALGIEKRSGTTVDRGGASIGFELDSRVAADVRRVCAAEACTPFMAYGACLAALVGRYSRSDDVALGVPVAGRTHPDAARLIGCFVNTLVLRVDVGGRPSFRELLRRTRTATLAAFAHQEVPFEHVVRDLRPGRDGASTPFFRVIFNFHESAAAAACAGPVVFTPFPVPVESAQFDLEVGHESEPDRMTGWFTYDTSSFERSSIERLRSHYGRLVTAVARDPDVVVGRVPLLEAAERRRLARGARAPAEMPSTLVDVVEPAFRSPHRTAVVCADGRRTTYGELDALSSRIAGVLRDAGVAPERRVAILLRRSRRMVAAVVAVVRAGGAYVPVDDESPELRVGSLLRESEPVVLLTERALVEKAPSGPWKVVLVDELDEGAPDPPATFDLRLAPSNLAYVMFTSGSTGTPKGVMVEHGGAANLVRAAQRFHALSPADRVIQFSSLAFDVSVREIFATLAAGAELHVAGTEERRSVARLTSFLKTRRITVAEFSPTVLQLLDPDAFPELRCVETGGERVSAALTNRWSPSRLFLNAYGATEGTVETTVRPCSDREVDPVPVGRPIANNAIYPVDDELQPVPVGVTGELLVAGAGVARGYLGRPSATAERFAPDPAAPHPGARVFRTGDLGRQLESGELVFVGRLDRQLKVRGIRVEPGEIESVVCRHEAVEAALVVEGDRSRLVGYVVVRDRKRPPDEVARDLRAHVRRFLPQSIVPSDFVVVDRIPLTVNGKVDEARLPRAARRRPRTPPRTPDERVVADVWRDVLGVDEIGVDDDFFEIGGHSLHATEVIAELARRGAADVSVAVFFSDPTVEGVAKAVASARSSGRGRPRALVHLRGTDRPAVVLVHPVGGGVLAYRDLAGALDPYRVLAFEADGRQPTVAALADAYVDELSRSEREPFVLAGWSMGGVIAYEMARTLSLAGSEAPVVLIDAHAPSEHDGDDEDGTVAAFCDDVARTLGVPPPDLGPDADLDEHSAVASALRVFQRAGAMASVTTDELAHRYSIYRANIAALRGHVPHPHSGPVHLVQAAASPAALPTWSPFTTPASVTELPGDHYAIMRGEGAAGVARVIRTVLRELDSG